MKDTDLTNTQNIYISALLVLSLPISVTTHSLLALSRNQTKHEPAILTSLWSYNTAHCHMANKIVIPSLGIIAWLNLDIFKLRDISTHANLNDTSLMIWSMSGFSMPRKKQKACMGYGGKNIGLAMEPRSLEKIYTLHKPLTHFSDFS